MTLTAAALRGAAAGAAGTTALNAATYLDMAVRGRGTSSTPERSVERTAERLHVEIPGDDEHRPNRVSGLGALNGILVGVGVGAALGALRHLGVRPGRLGGTVLAGAAAMVSADASMAALGVSDPRTWGAADWAADALPHLAYGAVTAAVLAG